MLKIWITFSDLRIITDDAAKHENVIFIDSIRSFFFPNPLVPASSKLWSTNKNK